MTNVAQREGLNLDRTGLTHMNSPQTLQRSPQPATSASRGINQKELRRYRLERVRAELVRGDYAAVLLFDPINIRYATGTSNMQVWTLHNAARYVLVPAQGPVTLFETHGCSHLDEGFETVDEIRSAIPWYYFAVGPRSSENAKRWADEIADLVRTHGGGNRRLAVDRCEPAGAEHLLRHGITLHDGQEVLELARVSSHPKRSKPCSYRSMCASWECAACKKRCVLT